MFNKNPLSAQDRLRKATVAILGHKRYLWLAGVLMIGKKEVTNDPKKTKTAYTNGRDEVYSAAFIDTLTDAELRFLVLHECYHKLYRHLSTWKHLWDRNAKKANHACDYVINIKLYDENAADGFAVMPKVGLLDERFRNMDAAKVWHMLDEDDGGSGKGGSGKGDPSDEDGDGGEGLDSSPAGDGGMDDHDWAGAQDMDEEEKKQLDRDIDVAVRQGAMTAAKNGSGGDRSLDELLEAKIDWRQALREFIQSTCAGKDFATWKRPSRRFIGAGIYMPSTLSERIGELVIGIDTSGSIGGPELSQFLGEVASIVESVSPEAIRILYWDTGVCGDEYYADKDIANIRNSTKPKGGGGTDAACVPKYLAEKGIKAQAVVMLTDGYLAGTWGTWDVPTLWAILNNKSATSPVGKTLHIDGEDLN